MVSTMNRLKAEEIEVGYGSKPVIQSLSIQIPDGQITSIIGANGCGKSTLLKSMSRIIPYQKGHVLLDGKSIHKCPTKELAKMLAILPQKPLSPEDLTTKELIAYGRFPHQKGRSKLSEKDYKIIDWALKVTGTESYKDQDVATLSGGQLQRVWIGMALAQDTEIIFLDEPTTYLDLAHQLEVLELLEKLNKMQKRTIVMVLHDINQAARFSDYMIAMKKGKIVKAGPSAEVMSKEVLKEVYNIEAYIGEDPLTKKPMCLSYKLA